MLTRIQYYFLLIPEKNIGQDLIMNFILYLENSHGYY